MYVAFAAKANDSNSYGVSISYLSDFL